MPKMDPINIMAGDWLDFPSSGPVTTNTLPAISGSEIVDFGEELPSNNVGITEIAVAPAGSPQSTNFHVEIFESADLSDVNRVYYAEEDSTLLVINDVPIRPGGIPYRDRNATKTMRLRITNDDANNESAFNVRLRIVDYQDKPG